MGYIYIHFYIWYHKSYKDNVDDIQKAIQHRVKNSLTEVENNKDNNRV